MEKSTAHHLVGRLLLERFRSPEELAGAAAHQWLHELASLAVGDYYAAISGGRIARQFLADVANGARDCETSLARVHFFWADERCVPPDHPESNFRLAQEQLFRPASIPSEHVHRIRGEESPARAAEVASAEVCLIVPRNRKGWPVFDIIFLGMGEDGHVASLFPPVDPVPARQVFLDVVASKPPPFRITLCYEAIAAAKQVWVVASGPGKEKALRDSVSAHGQTPLAHVIQSREETRILTDILSDI